VSIKRELIVIKLKNRVQDISYFILLKQLFLFPERRSVGFIFKASRRLFEYAWWGKIGGVSEPDNIHDLGIGSVVHSLEAL